MKNKPKDPNPSQTQAEVVEHVKARLLEEGREARNLIAYSLPLQDSSSSSSSSSSVDLLLAGVLKPLSLNTKSPESGLKISTKLSPLASNNNSLNQATTGASVSTAELCSDVQASTVNLSYSMSADSLMMPPPPPPTIASSVSSIGSQSSLLSPSASSVMSSDLGHVQSRLRIPEEEGGGVGPLSRRGSTKQEKRSRSVSAGRNPQQCLRARHWGFLFRNLQQAVDQIYQTCETDESVIECREAILMLERYTKDFRKLIEWLKIKWEYENTPPPQRPTSLAWEIRTSSQTKETRPLTLKDVRRALNFDQLKPSASSQQDSTDDPLSGLASAADSARVQQLAAELAADLTLSNRLNLAARVDRALSDRALGNNVVVSGGGDKYHHYYHHHRSCGGGGGKGWGGGASDSARLETALAALVEQRGVGLSEESDEGATSNKGNQQEALEVKQGDETSDAANAIEGNQQSVNEKIPRREEVNMKRNARGPGIFTGAAMANKGDSQDSKIPNARRKATGRSASASGKLNSKTFQARKSKVDHRVKNEVASNGSSLESLAMETSKLKQKSDQEQISKQTSGLNALNTQPSIVVEEASSSDTGLAGDKSVIRETSPRTVLSSSDSDQTNLAANVQSSPSCYDSYKNDLLLSSETVLTNDTLSANEARSEDRSACQISLDNKESPSKSAQDDPTLNEASKLTTKINEDFSEVVIDSTLNLSEAQTLKGATTFEPNAIPNSNNKRPTDSNTEIKKKLGAEAIEGRRPVSEAANSIIRTAVRVPPTVNMNKAWQVRQAFNQSRTPLKQPLVQPPAGVGEVSSSPRYSAPQPWLTGTATSHSAHIRNRAPPPPQPQLMQAGVAGRASCRRGPTSITSTFAAGRRATGSNATAAPVVSHSMTGMTRSHTTLGTCNGVVSVSSPLSASSSSSSFSSSRRSLGSAAPDARQLSWADKVRGPTVGSSSCITPSSSSNAPTTPSSTASSASLISSQAEEGAGVCGDAPGEGWEVVRRGRRSHGGSTASLNKHQLAAATPLHCPTKERASNWLKRRYNVPSSATSLPSLAALASSNSRTADVANEEDVCMVDTLTATNTDSNAGSGTSQDTSGKHRARRSTGDCKMIVVDSSRRVSLDSAVTATAAAGLIQSVLVAVGNDVYNSQNDGMLHASLISGRNETCSAPEADKLIDETTPKKTRSKSFIESSSRGRARSDRGQRSSEQQHNTNNKKDIQKSFSAEQLSSLSQNKKQARQDVQLKDSSNSFRGKKSEGFSDSSRATASAEKPDPKKKFLSRGKAASDVSIEWNRTVVRGNTNVQSSRPSNHGKSTERTASKASNSKESPSLVSKSKRITTATASVLKESENASTLTSSSVPHSELLDVSGEKDLFDEYLPLDSSNLCSSHNSERGSSYISNNDRVNYSCDNTNISTSNSDAVLNARATDTCPSTAVSSSRYGAIMTELYEEADEAWSGAAEEDVAGLISDNGVAHGSLLMISNESVRPEVFNKSNTNNSCPDDVVFEEDLEDAAADEEIRHNAAAFESAVLEEQRLKRQIHDTENTDCDPDTDEEMVSGDEEDEDVIGNTVPVLAPGGGCGGVTVPDGDRTSEACHPSSPDSPSSSRLLRHSLSSLYQEADSSAAILEMFATLDWSEEVTENPPSAGVREPGRVLQIHEKLSSPSRKLPLHEKLRRHNERLAKAELQRQSLLASKSEKLKELFKRIEEVNVDKERLLEEKRHLLERKMDRAEEKRRQHLQGIVDKAHDEDNKGREIAFINGLEAQNKLHDLIQQHQSHSSRLADMAEERSRRQEEKAAKEVAAQERRRALEAERQARLLELCEKRRERCERIDRQQAERREELLEQAREKARDRQERLTALMQAQQAKECELVRRIQLKQQESARRHEENIEQIKRRALESSILRCSRGCDDAPKIGRYERQKLCTLCQCLLSSEVYLLSHLRGARHQEALRELHDAPHVSSEDTATYNLKHIVDAPDNIEDPQVTRDKERQKALKKRCRKIRNRMATRGRDYDGAFKPSSSSASGSQHSKRISKALNSITRLQTNQGTGPWSVNEVAAVDKSLLELLRILDKKEASDQEAFCALNGYEKLTDFLLSLMPSDGCRDGDGKKGAAVTESRLGGESNKENPPRNSDSGDPNNETKLATSKKNRNNNAPSKKKNAAASGNKKNLQQQHPPQRSSSYITDDSDDLLSTITRISDNTTEDGSCPASSSAPFNSCVVPSKSVGLISRVLHTSLSGHAINCRHLLHSNLVGVLLDWLMHRLQTMALDTGSGGGATTTSSFLLALPSDPAVTHTLEASPGRGVRERAAQRGRPPPPPTWTWRPAGGRLSGVAGVYKAAGLPFQPFCHGPC